MTSLDEDFDLVTAPNEEVRCAGRIHRDDWSCEVYSRTDAGLELFLLEDLSHSGAFLVSLQPELDAKRLGQVVYGFLVAPDEEWRLPFTARIARRVTLRESKEFGGIPGFAIEFARIDRTALMGICPMDGIRMSRPSLGDE